MKKFLFSFGILFLLARQLHANEEIYEMNGIFYKTNRFGDIFPIWQNIPEQEFIEKLSAFTDTFKETKSPIIIQIPHKNSPILNAVMKSNFRFRYGDQNQSEWIVKNHSSIPHPFTAISGAHVIVIKNDQVLAIEERTRKGILGFPSGGAEPEEFIRETACRELYEEVGLIAQPEDLKLIALTNRKKANKHGASLYGHCFIVEKTGGKLNIDPIEVIQAFWVSIQDLVDASEIHHLKVSPYINALAKHIKNRCCSSYSLKLLDNRQMFMSFDPTDTMNVEFFYQNLNEAKLIPKDCVDNIASTPELELK